MEIVASKWVHPFDGYDAINRHTHTQTLFLRRGLKITKISNNPTFASIGYTLLKTKHHRPHFRRNMSSARHRLTVLVAQW